MSKADEIKTKEDEDKIIYFVENKRTGSEIYKFVIYKNAADKRSRLKIYEQYCSIELLKIINKKVKELGWLGE